MNNWTINYNTSARMIKILVSLVILEAFLLLGLLGKLKIQHPYKTLQEALRDSIKGGFKLIKNKKSVLNIKNNNVRNKNIAINYTNQIRYFKGSINLRPGIKNSNSAKINVKVIAKKLIEIINRGSNQNSQYYIMDGQDIKGGSYSHVFKLGKGYNSTKFYILKLGDVSNNEFDIIKNNRLIKENIIPKCYAYFNTDISIYGTRKKMRGYIQEYAGEPLYKYFLRNPGFRLKVSEFRNLLIKLLNFHYITGCYHGDLYEGNIVVIEKSNTSLDFKLIDFGMSFYTPQHCMNVGTFAKHIPNISNLSDYQIGDLIQRLVRSSDFERLTRFYPHMDPRPYRKVPGTNNKVLSNFHFISRIPRNRSMITNKNNYLNFFV